MDFIIFVIIIVSITVVVLSFQSIHSFAENSFKANLVSSSTAPLNHVNSSNPRENLDDDNVPPRINITYPFYPPTVTSGKIVIEGTASDYDGGIYKVSISAHTFPFRGEFFSPPPSPEQIFNSNSAKWSFPLTLNETGTYRIVVTATDNAGNENYAETTVNMILPKISMTDNSGHYTKPIIAFVRPTFTEAAYQPNGFFDFYYDYGFPPVGKNITTDLDMLTVKTPRSVTEFEENDPKWLNNITSLVPLNGTELHDISYNYFPVAQKFWKPFIDNVKLLVPNSVLTVIRDEDINDGHIFFNTKNTNAFNILLMFNIEYVTQHEYDNLKQFVKNGGTIVFIDANIFRAEVSYDGNDHTVTLVKGHDWKFDGKSASRSVPERWYNETKQWVGSNFLDIDANIGFGNNPFNYTHFEEQFVNNPDAKILVDYNVKFPKDFVMLYLKDENVPSELKREDIPIQNITIASYSLQFGKGKVIVLGLSGRLLADNQEFMTFFDNKILPIALCPEYKFCN
jgi:hypothetical protein